MPGKGFKGWMSLVEESVWATAPGAGEVYARLLEDGMDYDPNWKPLPGLSASVRGKYLGHVKCGGTVVPAISFDGVLGWLAKAGMGASNSVAGTNFATHTFSMIDDLDKSLNMEICKGDTPSGKVFRYDGAMVDQLLFELEPESVLRVTPTLAAKDRDPNSTKSGTPTYPIEEVPLFHYFDQCDIAGNTDLSIKRASILIANNLDLERYFLSRYIKQPVRKDKRQVSGSVLMEFEDNAMVDDFIAGLEGSFLFKMESVNDIPSSSPATKYSIMFSGDASFISKAEPKITDAGAIELPVEFQLLGNGDEMEIELVNGDTDYD